MSFCLRFAARRPPELARHVQPALYWLKFDNSTACSRAQRVSTPKALQRMCSPRSGEAAFASTVAGYLIYRDTSQSGLTAHESLVWIWQLNTLADIPLKLLG